MPIMPITPDEARRNKLTAIPPEVFEAFDELITKNLRGTEATVLQKEVVALILEKLEIEKVDFDMSWLNIEPVYEQAGWKVNYDRPTYCEDYRPASYTFTERI